jgi:hypothetical protein
MCALKAKRKVRTTNQNTTIHVPFGELCCRIFNAGSNNKRGGLYSGTAPLVIEYQRLLVSRVVNQNTLSTLKLVALV